MRKKFVISLAVILVLSMLSGCGSDSDNGGTEEGNVSEESAGQSSDWIYVSDLKVEDYVTLGEYKNLSVTVSALQEVTEEEVQSQTLQVYQSSVTAENGGVTDRAVATGDTVIMDYEGKKDGVAFDGGTAQGADLTIGSGRFIDGFEDGLIGVMPGETVDLNLTFPESYQNADLAGAKVVFTVTVHYIIPTQMQDEVVAGFGYEDYQTVEEMTQYVREYLEQQAQNTYEQNIQGALLNALMENASYTELPQVFVEQYEQQATESMQLSAASYGMDAETLVYYFYGMDMATYAAEYADAAAKQVLAVQAVAQKENLELSEENLDERIAALAEENGWASAEEFQNQFGRGMIEETIMIEDVVAFLKASATVTEQS